MFIKQIYIQPAPSLPPSPKLFRFLTRGAFFFIRVIYSEPLQGIDGIESVTNEGMLWTELSTDPGIQRPRFFKNPLTSFTPPTNKP